MVKKFRCPNMDCRRRFDTEDALYAHWCDKPRCLEAAPTAQVEGFNAWSLAWEAKRASKITCSGCNRKFETTDALYAHWGAKARCLEAAPAQVEGFNAWTLAWEAKRASTIPCPGCSRKFETTDALYAHWGAKTRCREAAPIAQVEEFNAWTLAWEAEQASKIPCPGCSRKFETKDAQMAHLWAKPECFGAADESLRAECEAAW